MYLTSFIPLSGIVLLQTLHIEPWVLSLVKRHVFLLVTGLLIIMVRWRVMGSTPPTFMVFDNPHSFQNGTLIRVRKLALVLVPIK